jgi:hypothetical protein
MLTVMPGPDAVTLAENVSVKGTFDVGTIERFHTEYGATTLVHGATHPEGSRTWTVTF